MRLAALALLLLAPLAPAQAESPAPSDWRASTLVEHSTLSNGGGDWNDTVVSLVRRWSRRESMEVEWSRTRRFSQTDEQAALGGTLAFSPVLGVDLRATYSASHRVLPESAATAALHYEFQPAWLLYGGLRTTRYPTVEVLQRSLMLEHYFGNWRVLGAAHFVSAFDRNAEGGELRTSWYYRDGASVGLILAAGQEATQLGPGQVAMASVRSVALAGQHPLGARGVSLLYGAHYVRQGSFYTRRGLSLGVQVDF